MSEEAHRRPEARVGFTPGQEHSTEGAWSLGHTYHSLRTWVAKTRTLDPPPTKASLPNPTLWFAPSPLKQSEMTHVAAQEQLHHRSGHHSPSSSTINSPFRPEGPLPGSRRGKGSRRWGPRRVGSVPAPHQDTSTKEGLGWAMSSCHSGGEKWPKPGTFL